MVIRERFDRVRQILAALLLVVMVVAVAFPVSAASSKVNSRIRQLMYYYQYYQDEAETDIARLIEEITELDPDQGDKWQRIMDFWSWMNREMAKIPDCLPDGLPEDDSLCIVVLGYGLESNGDMKPELIGRMETALNCALKYPNAYILCTGGGTAYSNKHVTEAGQMSKWLVEQGIDESRIITENQSWSTATNARYSCRLIREEYPQIHSLAIVSSDYHVRRGCLVFNTESVLTDSGLEIVGNAVYVANRDITETFTYQAYEISQLISVGYQDNAPFPALSKLKSITAEGETVCEAGCEPQITVTAHYDNGYSRDVTAKSQYSGIDFGIPGKQMITVSYTENEKTCTAELEIELLISETEPAPTETIPQTEPAPTETFASEPEITEPLPTETTWENTAPTASGKQEVVTLFDVVLVMITAGAVLLILRRKPNKGKFQK